MKLRIVGDVHGDRDVIVEIMKTCHNYDLTIQIGDYGAGFGAEAYLPLVSSEKFRVFAGNHDNPQILARYPHNLGRFGIFEFGDKKIFFVSGAWSIDYQWRTPGVSWWSDEELSLFECEKCLKLWDANCKDISYVLSHDGPPNFTQHMLGSFPIETQTERLLWEMYKIHEPPMWFIGHWHKSFAKQIGDTMFNCLDINEEFVIEI